jgi:CelD/BcsL family acetyltransferase involved in cellulose biosynthesis
VAALSPLPAAARISSGDPLAPSAALRDIDDPQWRAFVDSRPEATLFHLPGWSNLLASTYGYRPFVLAETDGDGQIVAGLPVMEVRRPLTGRRFASLPFTDHCPPLCRDAASLSRLTSALSQWWESVGRPRVEIRGAIPPIEGVHRVSIAVRHTLGLESNPERLLQQSRRDTRASIQRAHRDGVEVRLSRSPSDLVSFYRLHLNTRRRLGVPIQPRRFLERLWTTVIEPGNGFAVLASSGRQPIAGAIFLAWNGHLIYKYSASDSAYWKLRPTKLVLWKAIEWGCRHGYRLLDLGKTDVENSGLRDFKSSWGSTEVPLTYSYLGQAPAPAPGFATRAAARIIQSSPPIVCRMLGELLYQHFA